MVVTKPPASDRSGKSTTESHRQKSTKSAAMDKVKIKRVKRNKKTATGKEKLLAGLGVGGALMGVAGVVPQKPGAKPAIVATAKQSNNKSKTAESLKNIFKAGFENTLGAKTAKANAAPQGYVYYYEDGDGEIQGYYAPGDEGGGGGGGGYYWGGSPESSVESGNSTGESWGGNASGDEYGSSNDFGNGNTGGTVGETGNTSTTGQTGGSLDALGNLGSAVQAGINTVPELFLGVNGTQSTQPTDPNTTTLNLNNSNPADGQSTDPNVTTLNLNNPNPASSQSTDPNVTVLNLPNPASSEPVDPNVTVLNLPDPALGTQSTQPTDPNVTVLNLNNPNPASGQSTDPNVTVLNLPKPASSQSAPINPYFVGANQSGPSFGSMSSQPSQPQASQQQKKDAVEKYLNRQVSSGQIKSFTPKGDGWYDIVDADGTISHKSLDELAGEGGFQDAQLATVNPLPFNGASNDFQPPDWYSKIVEQGWQNLNGTSTVDPATLASLPQNQLNPLFFAPFGSNSGDQTGAEGVVEGQDQLSGENGDFAGETPNPIAPQSMGPQSSFQLNSGYDPNTNRLQYTFSMNGQSYTTDPKTNTIVDASGQALSADATQQLLSQFQTAQTSGQLSGNSIDQNLTVFQNMNANVANGAGLASATAANQPTFVDGGIMSWGNPFGVSGQDSSPSQPAVSPGSSFMGPQAQYQLSSFYNQDTNRLQYTLTANGQIYTVDPYTNLITNAAGQPLSADAAHQLLAQVQNVQSAGQLTGDSYQQDLAVFKNMNTNVTNGAGLTAPVVTAQGSDSFGGALGAANQAGINALTQVIGSGIVGNDGSVAAPSGDTAKSSTTTNSNNANPAIGTLNTNAGSGSTGSYTIGQFKGTVADGEIYDSQGNDTGYSVADLKKATDSGTLDIAKGDTLSQAALYSGRRMDQVIIANGGQAGDDPAEFNLQAGSQLVVPQVEVSANGNQLTFDIYGNDGELKGQEVYKIGSDGKLTQIFDDGSTQVMTAGDAKILLGQIADNAYTDGMYTGIQGIGTTTLDKVAGAYGIDPAILTQGTSALATVSGTDSSNSQPYQVQGPRQPVGDTSASTQSELVDKGIMSWIPTSVVTGQQSAANGAASTNIVGNHPLGNGDALSISTPDAAGNYTVALNTPNGTAWSYTTNNAGDLKQTLVALGVSSNDTATQPSNQPIDISNLPVTGTVPSALPSLGTVGQSQNASPETLQALASQYLNDKSVVASYTTSTVNGETVYNITKPSGLQQRVSQADLLKIVGNAANEQGGNDVASSLNTLNTTSAENTPNLSNPEVNTTVSKGVENMTSFQTALNEQGLNFVVRDGQVLVQTDPKQKDQSKWTVYSEAEIRAGNWGYDQGGNLVIEKQGSAPTKTFDVSSVLPKAGATPSAAELSAAPAVNITVPQDSVIQSFAAQPSVFVPVMKNGQVVSNQFLGNDGKVYSKNDDGAYVAVGTTGSVVNTLNVVSQSVTKGEAKVTQEASKVGSAIKNMFVKTPDGTYNGTETKSQDPNDPAVIIKDKAGNETALYDMGKGAYMDADGNMYVANGKGQYVYAGVDITQLDVRTVDNVQTTIRGPGKQVLQSLGNGTFKDSDGNVYDKDGDATGLRLTANGNIIGIPNQSQLDQAFEKNLQVLQKSGLQVTVATDGVHISGKDWEGDMVVSKDSLTTQTFSFDQSKFSMIKNLVVNTALTVGGSPILLAAKAAAGQSTNIKPVTIGGQTYTIDFNQPIITTKGGYTVLMDSQSIDFINKDGTTAYEYTPSELQNILKSKTDAAGLSSWLGKGSFFVNIATGDKNPTASLVNAWLAATGQTEKGK